MVHETTQTQKPRGRKWLRVTLKSLLILLAVLLLAFAGLRIVYPAILRASHAIPAPGIDRMEMVEIGGIQQAIHIRGQNADNPVILFLHGGPGSPMEPLSHMFQYDWEKDFTVVQWDQRNVGKTYYANDPEAVRQTMSGERMVEDAHEVTTYLRETLGKDKIIVMGHSWGSVLGTMLVQTYPQDYSAYIGVGQVVNMTDNERVGYEMVLEAARAAGNEQDIAALEGLAPYPPETFDEAYDAAITTLRPLQAKYGLATGMNLHLILNGMASPYYTFSELMYFFTVNAMYYQGDVMRFLIEEYDAHNFGLEYPMPVYYMMGENDYQTPYPLAKTFFDEITAPEKEFFSIPDAGHSPMEENKAEFTRILLEEIGPRIP